MNKELRVMNGANSKLDKQFKEEIVESAREMKRS
jgi:hypothetical protein